MIFSMCADSVIDARDIILDRLSADLIGPYAEDETFQDWPSDRYLTGMLFPRRSEVPPEQDDGESDAQGSQDGGTALDSIKASSTFRPSVAGVSFAVAGHEGEMALRVEIMGARYLAEPDQTSEETGRGRKKITWKREARSCSVPLRLAEAEARDFEGLTLESYGLSRHTLHARISHWGDVRLVTIALSNDAEIAPGGDRTEAEMAMLFQTAFSVYCEPGTRFVAKPDRISTADSEEDAKSAALLFRDVKQYAVGHTCSAQWEKNAEGEVICIRTDWLPQSTVAGVSAAGDREFEDLSLKGPDGVFGAAWLSRQNQENLTASVSQFVSAYECWIERAAAGIADLPDDLVAQAGIHMDLCRDAAARMRGGITLLQANPAALDAFRLANAAIALQYRWRPDARPEGLVWRPFQLGFALLCLESLADPACKDRDVMDLLWFPTGGGKTEAYLLLTAFTLFFRRIRAKGAPEGAGVAVFMRYTLRLLTIQQFERASALILACEQIRKGKTSVGPVVIPSYFRNDRPFSIGLWVGGGATPNKLSDLQKGWDGAESSPAQLRECPCCHKQLDWSLSRSGDQLEVQCRTSNCELEGLLPVWTVDDDIYREQPSLIIGTVDKYAQIVRKQEAGRLFGKGSDAAPPELIIQDELHLISGPLGSLAGLYETAIDALCRTDAGHRPKVIGSTATIRRASEQIGRLFDRRSFQFPPPGLDRTNSGFAVEDRDDPARGYIAGPARRYVGISTVGRSAKFTLQAAAASLLQSATAAALPETARDGYWTLVNYFNSLRELGGALVLMRDDTLRTIEQFAAVRCEEERLADSQIELTSRVQSGEIPRFLRDLARNYQDDDHVDVVLASNMISVGMDVSRLGLMLVNGQPKTIAEYIQATSRVGRDRRAPGLVLTLYNAAKSRDRSRYESFVSWHQSLYREVEATSVTPFAPRAMDRALHAPLVAMVRHLVPGMSDPSQAERYEEEICALVRDIVARVERTDAGEARRAEAMLEKFLESWITQSDLKHYWQDYSDALLISAEADADRGRRSARQKPTPNSLRSVEASSKFVLIGEFDDEDGEMA